MSEKTDPDQAANPFGMDRRPLLKLLGAGTGLAALGSGTGVADEHEDSQDRNHDGERGDDKESEDRAPRIDPRFGHTAADATNIPQDLRPDHTVDMYEVMPEGFPPESDGLPPEYDHPLLFVFEPAGLHISPGDIVEFRGTSPDHTVTAYHPEHGFQRRIPENVPPFSSPMVPQGGSWLYRFDQPGVYDLFCGPHHTYGMVMRLVVGDLATEELPDYVNTYQAEPPTLAPFSTEFMTMTLSAFAGQEVEWPFLTPVDVFETPSLDPMEIQDAGTVPFANIASDLEFTTYERPDGGH